MANNYLFFFLHWVSTAAVRLSAASVRRLLLVGASPPAEHRPRAQASAVAARGLSCLTACGTLPPEQGSGLRPRTGRQIAAHYAARKS